MITIIVLGAVAMAGLAAGAFFLRDRGLFNARVRAKLSGRVDDPNSVSGPEAEPRNSPPWLPIGGLVVGNLLLVLSSDYVVGGLGLALFLGSLVGLVAVWLRGRRVRRHPR